MSAEMRNLIEAATQDGSPEAVAQRIARAEIHRLVDRLAGDEVAVALQALRRLDTGRETYGPLRVDDGREWTEETLQELLDSVWYMTAELVRRRRQR